MFLVIPSPEKTLNEMFQALKDGDFEKVNEFSNYDEIKKITENDTSNNSIMSPESIENQKLLYESLEWNIKSIKTEGNTATAVVEVTNKDFNEIITNYMEKAFQAWFLQGDLSDEKAQEYLTEELKSQDIPVKTQEANITLEKENGKWKVKVDENLRKAIYPGLVEFVESIDNG